MAGACTGALLFGQLTDRFGRKRLFLITLGLYLLATVLTAISWTPWWFLAMRFLTGAGIGGEYAAINSAIDELIPARARGRVDLIINGSFWVGAAIGGLASIVLLKESIFALDVGWRISFALGATLGLGILLVRRTVPESPRWLFIHGREEEAERIVDEIERSVAEDTGEELKEPDDEITVRQRKSISFREIARTAFKVYPKRSVLGLSLFVGQAFIYNAVTITLGITLTTYFGVAANKVGLFYAVFAAGNFLGPLLLGRLFDTVGRKPMIAGTYLLSAIMLVGVAFLIGSCDPKSCESQFSDWTLTLALAATFFFASAGASAAYLTVSEIFPMEVRALAIAFFYAIGTAIGGITGPQVFEKLGSEGTSELQIAYLIGAGVMAIGGIVELFLGVRAEQEQLEDIAKPISVEEAEREEGDAGAREDDAEADRERRRRAAAGAPAPRRTAVSARAGDLLLAVHRRPGAAQRPLARQRGRDDPLGARGGRRGRSGRARPARGRPVLGPGSLHHGAARGRRRGRSPPDRPPPLRSCRTGRARRCRCLARRSPAGSWGIGRTSAPEGATMHWDCARDCGMQGEKRYPSAADAGRYAHALDHDTSAASLGKRAPLSLVVLRLARRRRSG